MDRVHGRSRLDESVRGKRTKKKFETVYLRLLEAPGAEGEKNVERVFSPPFALFAFK